MTMFNRKAALVICGVAILGVFAAAVGNASTFNKLTYLKFSGAVALPGTTLDKGEYSFSVVNPTAGSNVVVVRNKNGSKVYGLFLTQSVIRPANARSDASVTLGEARPGTPPPIKAWFPIGETTGYQFIY
jgi:hypothetical protein